METLVTIGYIAICILLFSIAIAIHEFGHFIVALKLGLRVERFSIGFGPALWKKTVNGVEYRISAIPLGGYVSIPDVDSEGTAKIQGSDKDSQAKSRIAPWKEILVSVAGPAMNIVLAVVFACILAAIPSARFGVLELNVDEVLPGECAEAAGILPGDKIISVNGRDVVSKTDMRTEFILAKGRESQLGILRDGTNVVVRLVPRYDESLGGVPIIGVILKAGEGSAAAAWMPGRNPLEQLSWDAGQMFRVLKALVTPKEMRATGNALGGPVQIAQGIYYSIRADFWDGIGFLRFLNMNLAVLNLLPIPVLDGGLILFSLFALVFRRRVPEKLSAAITTFFMYLLFALMIFLVCRDSYRTWKLHNMKGSSDDARQDETVESR